MSNDQVPNIPDNMSEQFSSALRRAQEIAQKLRSNAPAYGDISVSSSALAKVHQIASSISSKHNITGPNNVDDNEEVNDTMLIPASVAGLVIGKGGETIRMLQERSQCRMFMVQDGIYATGPDKLLTFGGPRARVEEGKRLVRDFLDDNDGLLKGVPTLSAGWVRNELTVPRESVGLIIGRSGETIKKINVDTNCRVYFRVMENNMPGDRVCIFEGLPDDIENAVMRVREIVALALRKNGIRIQQILLPQGYSIEEIPIKSQKANLIITRNNEYIKGVIAATGANIELNKGIDSTISRNFIVFGLPEQLRMVRDMFEERVGSENVLPSVQPTNCQIQRIPNPNNALASSFPSADGYSVDPMVGGMNPYDPSYAAMSQAPYGSSDPMSFNAAPGYPGTGAAPVSADPNVTAAWNSYFSQLTQKMVVPEDPSSAYYAQMNPQNTGMENPSASYYNQMNQQPLGPTDDPSVMSNYFAQMNQQPSIDNEDASAAWSSYYAQMNQQPPTDADNSAANAAWSSYYAQMSQQQNSDDPNAAWSSYYAQMHQQQHQQYNTNSENGINPQHADGDDTAQAQISVDQAQAWADYYEQLYQQHSGEGGDLTTAQQAQAWAKYYTDMVLVLNQTSNLNLNNGSEFIQNTVDTSYQVECGIDANIEEKNTDITIQSDKLITNDETNLKSFEYNNDINNLKKSPQHDESYSKVSDSFISTNVDNISIPSTENFVEETQINNDLYLQNSSNNNLQKNNDESNSLNLEVNELEKSNSDTFIPTSVYKEDNADEHVDNKIIDEQQQDQIASVNANKTDHDGHFDEILKSNIEDDQTFENLNQEILDTSKMQADTTLNNTFESTIDTVTEESYIDDTNSKKSDEIKNDKPAVRGRRKRRAKKGNSDDETNNYDPTIEENKQLEDKSETTKDTPKSRGRRGRPPKKQK